MFELICIKYPNASFDYFSKDFFEEIKPERFRLNPKSGKTGLLAFAYNNLNPAETYEGKRCNSWTQIKLEIRVNGKCVRIDKRYVIEVKEGLYKINPQRFNGTLTLEEFAKEHGLSKNQIYSAKEIIE